MQEIVYLIVVYDNDTDEEVGCIECECLNKSKKLARKIEEMDAYYTLVVIK